LRTYVGGVLGRPPTGFENAPFMVFWEMTQACDLACKHCRACAVPNRDPHELTTEQGRALLREIAALGCLNVVLTGGDPAKRADLVELVGYGTQLGLRMALTPSATPLVTVELLESLRAAGLARLAVSLDGASARSHDGFRGVDGSFERTFEILRAAKQLGLTTQINTTVSRDNIHELPAVAQACAELAIELWSVFFLVPTGRGKNLDAPDATEVESVLEWLADLRESSAFDIKTTAAPHFRRVLMRRKANREHIAGLGDGIGRAMRGVNDGQGIAFISHRGEVFPSGFLPVACGSAAELTRVYREHPLMVALRDPEQLEGKCGACEWKRVCGGSRARAYALTGNAFAEDPWCAHTPRAVASP
jgi:radical SAM protein